MGEEEEKEMEEKEKKPESWWYTLQPTQFSKTPFPRALRIGETEFGPKPLSESKESDTTERLNSHS